MRILKIVLLLTVLITLLPAHSMLVIAQDTANCDTADLFKSAAALKSSGDAKQDFTMLNEFSSQIRQANILCNGFKFEGQGNKPVGVVDLPAGTWLVTVTTKGAFILNSKLISGNCKAGMFGSKDGLMFNLLPGQGIEGSAAAIESETCKLLFTTSNVTAPWSLTFEPVS